MLVLVAFVVVAVWVMVATATVAVCVYAERAAREAEGLEPAPVIELGSSAA